MKEKNRKLPYALTYQLATFFLRHPQSLEVRTWEYEPIKQRNFANYSLYVGCYLQMLYIEILCCIGDIGLQLYSI